MSEFADSNWTRLADLGIEAESSKHGNWVKVRKLDKTLAVRIAHALTIQLDSGNRFRPMYDDYTLDRVMSEAETNISAGNSRIFGETRPAGRNCAVRVEGQGETYTLTADIRNEFEDDPRQKGAQFLQLGFVATIESLEI